MDVSIIIVNYNTLKMTQECINSVLEKTTGISIEIILVDNASKDGSKEHFCRDSRIRYIYSAENMGFGRANNVGMMLAKGEYFFLLNSDTLLKNNAVKEFLERAKEMDKRGTCNFYGSWLQDRDGNLIHSFGYNENPGTILKRTAKLYFAHFTKSFDTYQANETKQVDYITGADMFFHRSIYDENAGFDHQIFMYGEESDWQWRMKKKGIYSVVIPGPQIIHLEGQSSKSKLSQDSKERVFTWSDIMCERNRIRFVRNNCSLLEYTFFRIAYFILKLPMLFANYTFCSKMNFFSALIWSRQKESIKTK